MGYLPIGQIPKYLQLEFNKPTTAIKPKHKKFVNEIINDFLQNNECLEMGAKYDSGIGQGFRAFKKDNNVFIAIHPFYYSIKIN
jgi:hypothetical protein